MAPKLYTATYSPPCRSVLVTAEAIGLTLEQIEVSLLKDEHLKPEFLKMNPRHSIPTLVEENGTVIYDSHAITPYLVQKYGHGEDLLLYPKCLYKRAIIDQRMHYDSGVVWPLFMEVAMPIIRQKKNITSAAHTDKANEIYRILETILDSSEWIAGDSVTIADIHLYTSITTLRIVLPFYENDFPRLTTWLKRVGKLRYVECNKAGHDLFLHMLTTSM